MRKLNKIRLFGLIAYISLLIPYISYVVSPAFEAAYVLGYVSYRTQAYNRYPVKTDAETAYIKAIHEVRSGLQDDENLIISFMGSHSFYIWGPTFAVVVYIPFMVWNIMVHITRPRKKRRVFLPR